MAGKSVRRCVHTGSLLSTSSRLGPHFGISETGAIYYLKAKNTVYNKNYFFKEYEAQYGKSYFADEKNIRHLARRRLNLIKKYIRPPAKILEIGCAAGFFIDEAKKTGYSVVGIDSSEFAIDYAREKLGLDARVGHFLDAEINNRFDIVASFFVLEHFADQDRVLKKIAHLLKKEGLFSFALPSTNGPLFISDPAQWRKRHPIDHFVDYSPLSLRQILPHYGFELNLIRPASYHPERLKGNTILKLSKTLYRLYARTKCFGDTMEGIAIKK